MQILKTLYNISVCGLEKYMMLVAREWEYQDLLFCIEFYLLVIFAHSVEYSLNKLAVGDSNINLLTNKFNQLKLIIKNKDGMLVITETK